MIYIKCKKCNSIIHNKDKTYCDWCEEWKPEWDI